MTARWVSLGVFLAVALVYAPVHAQQDQTAVEHQARTRYASGDYQGAMELYARLYADTLHPTYLRNIGRCQQNLGQADKAISSFREYLRKARNLTAVQRAEVDAFIREMEELKRREARPDLKVTDAALHASQTDGQRPPVVIREREEPAPVYARWWFWTGIVAVAGAAVAVVALSNRREPYQKGTLGDHMFLTIQ